MHAYSYSTFAAGTESPSAMITDNSAPSHPCKTDKQTNKQTKTDFFPLFENSSFIYAIEAGKYSVVFAQ